MMVVVRQRKMLTITMLFAAAAFASSSSSSMVDASSESQVVDNSRRRRHLRRLPGRYEQMDEKDETTDGFYDLPSFTKDEVRPIHTIGMHIHLTNTYMQTKISFDTHMLLPNLF